MPSLEVRPAHATELIIVLNLDKACTAGPVLAEHSLTAHDLPMCLGHTWACSNFSGHHPSLPNEAANKTTATQNKMQNTIANK